MDHLIFMKLMVSFMDFEQEFFQSVLCTVLKEMGEKNTQRILYCFLLIVQYISFSLKAPH